MAFRYRQILMAGKQKSKKVFVPNKHSNAITRIMSIEEENDNRRRLLSASPERKVDKITLAQQRMKARATGGVLDTQGQHILTTNMNNWSDDDASNEDDNVDENFIPEGFRKQAMMTIPANVKNDPTKYYKFMSTYFKGEAKLMFKQKAQFTAPLRQTLIEHRPFDQMNQFKANNQYEVGSRYHQTERYSMGLREQA
jgi:hypothetical protein